MSVKDFILFVEQYSTGIGLVFILIPLTSFLVGKMHPRKEKIVSPLRYVYSFLVYLTCVPGMLSAVVTAYSLFFLRANLLEVNFLIYFLPMVSMFVTLMIIARNVTLDDIPGFDRLSDLMVLLGVTFFITLGIQKTRLWILFAANILVLFLIMMVLFLLLRWSAHSLFKQRAHYKLPGTPDQ